eukprot:360261-Chlamydomonas_euryale.AAC.3
MDPPTSQNLLTSQNLPTSQNPPTFQNLPKPPQTSQPPITFHNLPKPPNCHPQIGFTCKRCGARTYKPINPVSFEGGTLVVQCGKCECWHKIRDHLRLFHELLGDVFIRRVVAWDVGVGMQCGKCLELGGVGGGNKVTRAGLRGAYYLTCPPQLELQGSFSSGIHKLLGLFAARGRGTVTKCGHCCRVWNSARCLLAWLALRRSGYKLSHLCVGGGVGARVTDLALTPLCLSCHLVVWRVQDEGWLLEGAVRHFGGYLPRGRYPSSSSKRAPKLGCPNKPKGWASSPSEPRGRASSAREPKGWALSNGAEGPGSLSMYPDCQGARPTLHRGTPFTALGLA